MKTATAVLAASVIAFVTAVLAVSCTFGQAVIRVPNDYRTIQEAVDAATPGSTVLVSNGTYVERVVVDKPLKLIGEDKTTTILDGENGTTITVAADNVHIDGFTIKSGAFGIFLNHTSNCTINDNIMVRIVYYGIYLENSNNNIISNNLAILSGFTQCGALDAGGGITLEGSSGNIVTGNIMADNVWGIDLIDSAENIIHHNSFINNSKQVIVYKGNNTWDDGVEGNYWDTYTGLDNGYGGRVAGDGIGDTGLPHLGVDNYPLINPYGPIPIVLEGTPYFVGLHSNSTVSKIRFVHAEKKITFNVNGPIGTAGYCNVTIPKSLLRGPWAILPDVADVALRENETYTLIHLTYDHGAYNVQVIGTWVAPEFSSPIILLILMILVTTLIMAVKTLRRNWGGT